MARENIFTTLYRRQLCSDVDVKGNLSASPHLVDSLCRSACFAGHQGCVNTVAFNQDGSKLISGSDDRRIKLWDYYTGKELASFQSDHTNNIFQARAKPGEESTILSCAADGKVCLSILNEDGSTAGGKQLGRHRQRAHKLALTPGEPNCFYSCGEDSRVVFYDLRCDKPNQSLLECKKQHIPLGLYSIHCNPTRPWQFVVGGDDSGTRVYDHRTCMRGPNTTPSSMSVASPVRVLGPGSSLLGVRRSFSPVHVTCAVFSEKGEILASYGSGNICRFRAEPAVRETARQAAFEVSRMKRARTAESARSPKRAASDPSRAPAKSRATTGPDPRSPVRTPGGGSENPFHTARPSLESESGRVGQIQSSGNDSDPAQQQSEAAVQRTELQPEARDSGEAVLTTGRDDSTASEDSQPDSEENDSDAPLLQEDEPMEVRMESVWSSDDEEDVLWAESDDSEADFDGADESVLEPTSPDAASNAIAGDDEVLMTYSGHTNSRTVKGVSFLGRNDEYVMSGSDCGYIFIWRTKDGKLVQLLRGDNDVVNCLTPHPTESMTFATSGIDSDFKLWSPTAENAKPLDSDFAKRHIEANARPARPWGQLFYNFNALRELGEPPADGEEDGSDDRRQVQLRIRRAILELLEESET